MKARVELSPQLLSKWRSLDKQCFSPVNQKEYEESSLAELCRRRNGHSLFNDMRRLLSDKTIKACYFFMLESAVKDGSAEMVKVCKATYPKFQISICIYKDRCR